jgi:hypothetical protein
MCVAGLHVSTQCAHRWYELRKACQPTNNLANCTEKLQLEGWENRGVICPWCDETETTPNDSTHRLFGSTSSASPSIPSPTSPDAPHTRSRRSGSEGTLDSLSRVSSINSVENDRGQKHRDMNERLEIYLRLQPHEVLPSAKKNYPTYSQVSSTASSADDSASSEFPLIRRSSSGLSKHWKKSVRLSRGIFRS